MTPRVLKHAPGCYVCAASTTWNRLLKAHVLDCHKYGWLLQAVSIQLGIPVRVIRKNHDRNALFGNVFVYDGLYNVVKSPQPSSSAQHPCHIAHSQPASTGLLYHLLNATICCLSG